jgi:2-hydroxy-3-keto-5-methylthiopentenyl-1-phosphate phosphatase
VTEVDSLHLVLEEFGDVRVYHAAEARLGRKLALHEVISLEFETVTAPLDEVVAWVRENVAVRPGFDEFVRRFRPLVVSSGFRELIEPVLEREGIEVELRANGLEPGPEGWRAVFRNDVPCAVCGEPCKRADVEGLGDFAFVGDGYSDRCVSLAAARVFARDGLARHLDGLGRRHERYDDFHEIGAALARVTA